MSADLALWMFPALLAAVFVGVPVAFALMSVALVFGLALFGDAAVVMFAERVKDITDGYMWAAVPLFIFMGTMLERSGIAESLFETIHLWTRYVPGGLAVGTVVICVLLAVSSGVVGATETLVGTLAAPVMLRYGYEKGLIAGTVCAGGSLWAITPPSILIVILAIVADVGVGALLAAMLLPGLILAGLYIVYILVYSVLRPAADPRPPRLEDETPLSLKFWRTVLRLLPVLILIVAVLGTIVFAVAVPTEAAAVGALGALALTVAYGRFSLAVLRQALLTTLSITATVLTIVVGGLMFSGVFADAGGLTVLKELLLRADFGSWEVLSLILLITFVAGFVLDFITIMLIVVPLTLPIVTLYGFDALWFVVVLLIMLQTSLLTPPLAGAVFHFRAVAPPEITRRHMYWGVVPFIALHFVVLGLIIAFPALTRWLPAALPSFL